MVSRTKIIEICYIKNVHSSIQQRKYEKKTLKNEIYQGENQKNQHKRTLLGLNENLTYDERKLNQLNTAWEVHCRQVIGFYSEVAVFIA